MNKKLNLTNKSKNQKNKIKKSKASNYVNDNDQDE